jgi:hypothetical protein
MRRAIRSVLPTTMADTYTLNRRRQICRSAPDLHAPNARTERRQMSVVRRALSARTRLGRSRAGDAGSLIQATISWVVRSCLFDSLHGDMTWVVREVASAALAPAPEGEDRGEGEKLPADDHA